MDLKQAKNKINKIDWYNQAGAVKILYISYPLFSCETMVIFGKKMPIKYNIMMYIHNNFMDDYISKDSLKKVALYYFKIQQNDPQFIKKLITFWHNSRIKPFLKLKQEIMDNNLDKLSDKELIGLFKKFTKNYLDVWQEVIFLDGYDYYGEQILNDLINKEKKNIAGADLEILLTPPGLTFTQQERIGLLNIAEKNINGKKASVNNQQLIFDLKKMSKQFYWIHNDFSNINNLGTDYFYKNFQELLSNRKKIEEEKKAKLLIKNLKERKKVIYKEYNLSKKSIYLIEYFSYLANLRDERKSYSQMAGGALRKFAEEFSRRVKMDVDLIEHLYYWELIDLFKNKKMLVAEAKMRKKGLIHMRGAYKNKDIFYGKKASELNMFIKRAIIKKNKGLNGRSAFPGKASGAVKIINNKNDFYKMKNGDILVAPNTRPEYVPIMKVAGAILTAEGGMTCHAAIVSRELRIPCVVGMQGIISKLKDGDLVEVDADKGIVRIIKKAKK